MGADLFCHLSWNSSPKGWPSVCSPGDPGVRGAARGAGLAHVSRTWRGRREGGGEREEEGGGGGEGSVGGDKADHMTVCPKAPLLLPIRSPGAPSEVPKASSPESQASDKSGGPPHGSQLAQELMSKCKLFFFLFKSIYLNSRDAKDQTDERP
jgi:hypothetical protein